MLQQNETKLSGKPQNVPRDSEADEDERNGRRNIDSSLQYCVIPCCQSREMIKIL
jgi:hypothetical protein